MKAHRWWRALIREIVYALDIDDGNGSPSLTKMMALALVVLAFLAVLQKLSVSGNIVLLVVVAISAAFGRSAWMRYLSRGTWNTAASTVDVTERKTTDIRQEIINRQIGRASCRERV